MGFGDLAKVDVVIFGSLVSYRFYVWCCARCGCFMVLCKEAVSYILWGKSSFDDHEAGCALLTSFTYRS